MSISNYGGSAFSALLVALASATGCRACEDSPIEAFISFSISPIIATERQILFLFSLHTFVSSVLDCRSVQAEPPAHHPQRELLQPAEHHQLQQQGLPALVLRPHHQPQGFSHSLLRWDQVDADPQVCGFFEGFYLFIFYLSHYMAEKYWCCTIICTESNKLQVKYKF